MVGKLRVEMASPVHEEFQEATRLCKEWVEAVIGDHLRIPSFYLPALRDGVILCRLMNCLRAGSITKVNESDGVSGNISSKRAAKNVTRFLSACSKFTTLPNHVYVVDKCWNVMLRPPSWHAGSLMPMQEVRSG